MLYHIVSYYVTVYIACLSCDIHTHTPAERSYTNFIMYAVVA